MRSTDQRRKAGKYRSADPPREPREYTGNETLPLDNTPPSPQSDNPAQASPAPRNGQDASADAPAVPPVLSAKGKQDGSPPASPGNHVINVRQMMLAVV